MRLAEVRNLKEWIQFWQAKGFRMSECALVPATVYPVHSRSSSGQWLSRHYMIRTRAGVITPGPLKPVFYNGRTINTPQGKLGVDINWNYHAAAPGQKPYKTETEALTDFFERNITWAERHNIPLHSLFFDGLGFMEVYGYGVNHPIGGHDTHAHADFNDTHFYRGR